MLQLRRDGVCADCSTSLAAGTRAGWDSQCRQVRCLSCLATPTAPGITSTPRAPAPPPPVAAALTSSPPAPLRADEAVAPTGAAPEARPAAARQPEVARSTSSLPTTSGESSRSSAAEAGASAQREYERRSAKREASVRGRHPRLGGLILALTDEPASTRVWAQGARGERAVATALDELTGTGVLSLHDRRLRRPDGQLSTANIDHIAIAASGVWVIDAKTHQGRLEVRRTGGLFSPRVEKLYIAGRDQARLLDGLAGQVDAVTTALAAVRVPVTVRGALCFVGTELPWRAESIADVPLVGRRGLAKLLTRPGDLTHEDREALARHLGDWFPPAH